MDRKLEEIKKKLKELKPIIQEKYRVQEIGIFGSFLRREQKVKSDLDLLVKFSGPIGFFDFLRLVDFLIQKLGIKVDLVIKDTLKPRIKNQVI
jgi:uncharacterized protein